MLPAAQASDIIIAPSLLALDSIIGFLYSGRANNAEAVHWDCESRCTSKSWQFSSICTETLFSIYFTWSKFICKVKQIQITKFLYFLFCIQMKHTKYKKISHYTVTGQFYFSA